MSLRVWIWLVSLSVLWGGSFFFAKVAVAELRPLTVVFGRVALAAFALNLSLWLTGQSLFRRETPWAAFMLMGLLNNLIPFSLIFWGQTHIASGLASILNATTPLFTLVVAHVTTRDERINGAKVAALLTGFTGVVFLLGPDLLLGNRSGLGGQLACLAAALSYAFAGVYGRRFQSNGRGADAGGRRAGLGQRHVDSADHAAGRPTVDAAGEAVGVRLDGAGGPSAAVDSPRLCALFQDSRRNGCHQPASRHLSDTAHGHPARHRLAGGASR